ncbi:FAD-binding oxidoreductase [Telmatocola sphagniphila]|uniref:FAD-binding oxidoreductase n=1 Tax=Telmatocola sphagniphila TaxID=1123043 RepID=A0A8E6B9Q9_9BACT|nr:FAD-binding oxidoreductase [Telmatocola sphagniphila]QVL34423.1 FAD-binding oxidoreductase [Telmatocola sphagniphila]
MTEKTDVVILGGGVIGLTTAYHLALEGLQVTVLDKSDLGREASWAGAGILAPGNLSKAHRPLDLLRAFSRNRIESFSLQLKESSGIWNGFRKCGILDLEAPSAATQNAWVDEEIAFQSAEPSQYPQVQFLSNSGIFFPDGALLENPLHLQALIRACEIQGVRLRPNSHSIQMIKAENRIESLATVDGKRFAADRFVIATGAWTELLPELTPMKLGIFPIRGQIVQLAIEGEMPVSCIVESGKQYIVPRNSDEILIGSTEEPEAGFEKANTPSGIQGLLDFAHNLIPILRSAQQVRAWAGLRPGSKDGLPTIGPIPGFDNVFIGAGHGRSGIQQSLATAQILTDLVLGKRTFMDISPFKADRPRSQATEPLFRS